jgi:cytochrome c
MKVIKMLSLLAAGVVFMAPSGANAAGDAANGKKLAGKCKVCHTMNKGGKNRLGPNLYGIIGQKAAVVKGYKYSKAMKASGLVWDDSTFMDFVAKPKNVVKRTKMSFKGFKKANQRADLLAYFKTLGAKSGLSFAGGNVADGKIVAKNHCIVCHTFEKGGKTVFGPNLFDMVGKPAAALKGVRYSKALLNSRLTWTDANLIGFLAKPEQFLPGTTARFPGLKTAKQKADILAYMKSLK